MPYYSYNDPLLILVLIVGVLSMLASMNVKSTFNKFNRVRSIRGMTGREAARYMLDRNGLHNVQIEHIGGELSDHYDPRAKVVRLSDSVYNSNTIAAISVACHEVGHAIQHSVSYAPLQFRSMFFPIAAIGSQMGMPLAMMGLIFSFTPLIDIGIIVFSAAVIFQIITLPVEFNASSRAIRQMGELSIIDISEKSEARKVLTAAALTYVAAAASAMISLARLILIRKNRD